MSYKKVTPQLTQIKTGQRGRYLPDQNKFVIDGFGGNFIPGSGQSVIAGYFKNTSGTVTFVPTGGTQQSVSKIYISDTGVAEPAYAGSADTELKALISKSISGAYSVPYGVTTIGQYIYAYCSGITSVVIPDSVTYIGNLAFYYCTGLQSISIPNSVLTIMPTILGGCTSLKSLTIPSSVTNLQPGICSGCTSLQVINLPNTNLQYFSADFYACTALTTCNLQDNFAGQNLDLSDSILLTHDSMVDMFAALATVSTSKTLTLGSTNLAKLTAEEIAVATNKGWTIN